VAKWERAVGFTVLLIEFSLIARLHSGAHVLVFIERFSPLASDYDVLLCDVWGVVHNGIAASMEAGDALARFRAGGGTVILITNAPFPADAVQRFLDRLAVRRDAYDAITSSGDVTRSIVEARIAECVFHLGPPRDLPLFAGLNVTFAPVESADYVVCSGLFDDATETPEDYRNMLAFMRTRSLFMVCANPDVFVERGDALLYCAGALADAYVALGGEAHYCGKPHPPIYEAALDKAAVFRGGEVPPLARVLAIGDSIRTDLKGAATFGVDCLFVVSGLHASKTASLEPVPQRSDQFLALRIRHGAPPIKRP
jgi:HAD superfamily hydrolase (TIGR01459 family)